MPSNNLEQYLSLNDQLLSLVQLGVAFDLGISGSRDEVCQRLQGISAEVARKVSQGETLESTLENMQQDDLRRYAAMMRYGLAANHWPAALERSVDVARASSKRWRTIRLAVAYPLLLCILAYAGFTAFCVYLVPPIESLYTELRLSMAPWTARMSWFRANLEWWAWGPPLLLAIASAWLLRRPSAHGGSSTGVESGRRAQQSDMLGDLMLQQVSKQQACNVVAAVSQPKPSRPHRSTPSLGGGDGQAHTESLPPLLGWMMGQSQGQASQAKTFHAVADSYRGLAATKADRSERRASIAACVFIGGGAALLYALALFLPLVELLITLSIDAVSTPPY